MPGIVEAQGVVAFNEFTNDVVKLKPAPWGSPAGVWLESDELELGDWLTREHWLPPMSRQTLEEAVSMVARRHHYHPARERIEAQRGKWDGEKRLGMWLAHCCRKEGQFVSDDPLGKYLARVGTWLVMAICQRVLQPGCKFDYMLILEGPQGMGKSTLCRHLGMDWFADTGLVLGDKDSYQNLQGILVYEWGELDSLTRAEVTKVKQFISSQKDRFRASFDRRPKDYPRQVVFIGTTNESHYLSDPTGNRRFWPVKVNRFIDLDWLQENLPQMIAEALTYLEAGERYHPNAREQSELFEPQQVERTIENALESAIRKFLYDDTQRATPLAVNGSMLQEVTLAELLTMLGISVDKQTPALAKQASAALGRMGWERARSSSTKGAKLRPWVYRRPPEAPEPAPAPGSTSSSPTQDINEEDANEIPF
jgi:predicted P-loop ATPase